MRLCLFSLLLQARLKQWRIAPGGGRLNLFVRRAMD
jgi:hypothetical protein